jgi:hypothetical protein
MGLNFLKKNDSDQENKSEPPSGHNLSIKNNLPGFETRYKGWFINNFCCFYTDRVTKTLRIRTEGFSFLDKSSGTDPTYAA